MKNVRSQMGYQGGVSKCVRIKIVNRELKQVEENIKISNEPLTLQSNLCVFVHLSEIRDQTHDVARDALVAGQEAHSKTTTNKKQRKTGQQQNTGSKQNNTQAETEYQKQHKKFKSSVIRTTWPNCNVRLPD